MLPCREDPRMGGEGGVPAKGNADQIIIVSCYVITVIDIDVNIYTFSILHVVLITSVFKLLTPLLNHQYIIIKFPSHLYHALIRPLFFFHSNIYYTLLTALVL
jgi:hypothetical protein